MRQSNFQLGLICAALVFVHAVVQGAESDIPSQPGVRLQNYFHDSMVVQRDTPWKVQGVAPAGTTVTVTFGAVSRTGRAGEDRVWSVTLPAMEASGRGRALIARSAQGATAEIADVVVGDVWLIARQTSVDVSLGRNESGRRAAASYTPSPRFRAVRIEAGPWTEQPRRNLDPDRTTGWAVVDRDNAPRLSGYAFHFGQALAEELDIPVGIIDANMGHYFPAAWLSETEIRASATQYGAENGPAEFGEQLIDRVKTYEDGGWSRLGEPPNRPPQPALIHPREHPLFPSACYNSVIAPLRGLAIKGALVQVGANYPYVAYAAADAAGRGRKSADLAHAWAMSYETQKYGWMMDTKTVPLIPGMLRDAFGDAELPIGMIVPPGSALGAMAIHNREMRELQRRVCDDDANLSVILPPSAHIPMSGQPADDPGVSRRCRQWALGQVYDRRTAPTGPVFERAETRLSTANVYFRGGTAQGLRDAGAALQHFEVAGPDKRFSPAQAQIDGSAITLTSDTVANIQSIRYDWQAAPSQELVNAAGLPALPFLYTDGYSYRWLINNAEPDLPSEYRTPANEWEQSDVAIVNGSVDDTYIQDWELRPSHLGPTGMRVAEFGPNLAVIKTEPGTPSHGKVFRDDVIFSANGRMLGFQQHRTLANAITESETKEGGGKLTLGIRRNGKNINVELQLKVLGSYSSTTPYYCPKSEKIVADAEAWVVDRAENGGQVSGFLGTDIWFLLASGTPKHQGLVRRAVYQLAAGINPEEKLDPYTTRIKTWYVGYNSVLLGEYFNATGDRNVLPHLKKLTEKAAISQVKPPVDPPLPSASSTSEEQIGGWFHNYPGGGNPEYGFMELPGMACVMGMAMARDAGLEIDQQAFEWGLRHFRKGRAEFAHIIYARTNLRRSTPTPIDPEAEANGMLRTYNGKLASAAVLFDLVGDGNTAEVCSRHCVYSFNRTYYGHGGAFFNNFWSPIGATVAGRKGFVHFMKGHTWYRELFRRHDGSMRQVGRGGIGVGFAIPYVAPEKRLRILGAPKSAFCSDPPQALEPALESHRNRDYARCEEQVRQVLESAVLTQEEQTRAEHMLRSVTELRESIAFDLERMERRVADGDYYRAGLDLEQLRGVVSPDNARLATLAKTLTSPEGRKQIAHSKRRLEAERKDRSAATQQARQEDPGDPEVWVPLITRVGENPKTPQFGEIPADQATRWRIKIVESMSQAPDGWTEEDFDDTDWEWTTLRTTWRMYHTALLRTKFTVDDLDAIEKLRLRGRFFRQLNIQIYINGTLVAKVDQTSKFPVTKELTDLARQSLRKGENTLCITTRHNWRWASRMNYATGVAFLIDAMVGAEPGEAE